MPDFQEMIKSNLEQIRMLYLQTFEELTHNQSNIEIIIKEVLEKKIDEKEALERINQAVNYAEKLQKGFSEKMRENLNRLLENFPEAQSSEIQSIKGELENIYSEMEEGVSKFVDKVKELYKV
jgi:seryl-tRNA synthetase